MLRVPGGIEHVAGVQYELTPADAIYLLVCTLVSLLGLKPEDLSAPATPKQ